MILVQRQILLKNCDINTKAEIHLYTSFVLPVSGS